MLDMTMHIIPGDVIVMNKTYWNDYVLNEIDEEIILETMKYNQMISYKLNDYIFELDNEKIYLLECDEVKKPTVNIEKIGIEEFDNIVQGIYSNIKEAYGSQKYIISLPVIYIRDKEMSDLFIPSFKNNSIIKYNNKKNKMYIHELMKKFRCKIGIFLLIDIDKSVALFKEKGYIKAIEQSGWIYFYLLQYLNKNKIFNINLKLNEQLAINNLGLNLTKIILINNIFIREV